MVFAPTGILMKWFHKGRNIASQNSLREHYRPQVNSFPHSFPLHSKTDLHPRNMTNNSHKHIWELLAALIFWCDAVVHKSTAEQRATRPNSIKVYLITVAFDLHCSRSRRLVLKLSFITFCCNLRITQVNWISIWFQWVEVLLKHPWNDIWANMCSSTMHRQIFYPLTIG